MGKVSGNWINDDVAVRASSGPSSSAIVDKAKQLMREAGYPERLQRRLGDAVPPFYSRGERVVAQLQAIGIRAKLQTMERGVFLQKLQGGLKEWPGRADHPPRRADRRAAGRTGTRRCSSAAASMPRTASASRTSTPSSTQYEPRSIRAERKKLAEEIQRGILENYYFVPVFRHAFVNAIGPRIAAQKWQDVFPTITTGYAYPWEDIKLEGVRSEPGRPIGMAQFIIRRRALQHRHAASS